MSPVRNKKYSWQKKISNGVNIINLFHTASSDKWKRIGLTRRAGVLVPLFSVYSQNSVGIADLDDLRLLVDWVEISGNSILQLLPMNEVGSLFCPYDAISSFALEPMYLSLRKLTGADKFNIQNKIKELRQAFPLGRTHVDYRIKNEKLRLIREIFNSSSSYDCPEFNKFVKQNCYWIEDFVLYKIIKEYQNGRSWYEWEDKFKNRRPEELGIFKKEHEREILFQMWLQWQLYKQFKDAKDYAASKEVLLKGDLPIFVSKDSADVWSHPEFFKLEFAAGAPPDMYCALGQRWGMPTYNWERIANDGYRYIKEKLKTAQEFYDILRIDHVVGLFRVWSIPQAEPLENQGLNGSFDPADENKWKEQGRNLLLVLLNNTKMLLCAEDLGIIPKICPETLKEFGIVGNDVQRWVKDWKIRHDFLKPKDYRFLSVTMLSTHDTTNWPAWWENEAGTVDEALFIRKCNERRIDYNQIKDKLFDSSRSHHGRLRWKDEITSVEILAGILAKRKEELMDFIDIYENSYQEKEKLWRHLKIKGLMREKSDPEIIRAVLKLNLKTKAIFCIQLIIDWLFLTDIFKEDPYNYRINKPGTISPTNWSLALPISLEELLKHKVNKEIRKMVSTSGR